MLCTSVLHVSTAIEWKWTSFDFDLDSDSMLSNDVLFFVDKINTFRVMKKKQRISLFITHGKFNLEPKRRYYWENVIEFPRKEMKKKHRIQIT